ncbi:MAG: YcxB family protein [Lachnospiraceae bacterium]|nr:YcxB family protein [Lachnospiraceae bacterium]
MEFRYRYSLRAFDLWQLSMYYAYASFLAVINVVCTVSAFALIVSCWNGAGFLFRAVMVVFASLFTVIQPLVIYGRAKKRLAAAGNREIELLFDEAGLTVTADGRTQRTGWGQIRQVAVRPTLIVVYADSRHGYILPNRVLLKTRKDFLDYLNKKRGER